jgi:hypothetical protein
MPEPLDPTDAIFSAASGFFVRFGWFAAITLGGHCFGLQMTIVPDIIGSLNPANGMAMPGLELDPWIILGSWIAVMLGSFFKLATLPFILFAIWSFYQVLWGSELFRPLFLFGLAQPIHTVVAIHHFNPMSAGALWSALGLTLLVEAIAAALVIWWWNTIQNSPQLPAEPEL